MNCATTNGAAFEKAIYLQKVSVCNTVIYRLIDNGHCECDAHFFLTNLLNLALNSSFIR